MFLIPALFFILVICIVGTSYLGLRLFVSKANARVWSHLLCTVMIFVLGFIADLGSSVLGSSHHDFYVRMTAAGMLMTAVNYFFHLIIQRKRTRRYQSVTLMS